MFYDWAKELVLYSIAFSPRIMEIVHKVFEKRTPLYCMGGNESLDDEYMYS